MDNENKNNGQKCGCGKVIAIIAIILSIISITLSAFTLGLSVKNNKNYDISNTCPMTTNCPMQDFANNQFTPIWPMFNNRNRMNSNWKDNINNASSSDAKRKIGGYSPYNKAYDKKPVQEISKNQSPQEYKTFDAPDANYGKELKERERLKKEKRESIATREETIDD